MENLLGTLYNPHPRRYQLFISHAWSYDEHYKGVLGLLDSDITFQYDDLSVGVDNPLPLNPVLRKSHWTIMKQLEERIQRADCLLVMAAMYFNHSGWIQSEIEMAWKYSKPIIAIAPRGQVRLPDAVNQIEIAELVRWNTSSLISAIRRCAPPATAPSPSPAPPLSYTTLRSAFAFLQLQQLHQSNAPAPAAEPLPAPRLMPPTSPIPTLGGFNPPPMDAHPNLNNLLALANSSNMPAPDLLLRPPTSSTPSLGSFLKNLAPVANSSGIPTPEPSPVSFFGNLFTDDASKLPPSPYGIVPTSSPTDAQKALDNYYYLAALTRAEVKNK